MKMIKIKNYIFDENKIVYIHEYDAQSLGIMLEGKDTCIIIDTHIEDIEWNYGSDKAQISLQNQLVKLQQRIDKSIEYIEDNIAVYGFGNKALPHWEFDDNNIQELLKILKGEEK